MGLSSFLIRAVFIAIPGIVGNRVYRSLKGAATAHDWQDYSSILIFGLFSYLGYGAFLQALGLVFSVDTRITALQALFNENLPISWWEIIFASLFGILIAYAGAGLSTYRIVNRLGQKLKVTARFGDEDLWQYFHDATEVDWVVVRDHKVDLVYYGRLKSYSSSKQPRELVLSDVRVYSNTSDQLLYEIPLMYVSRDPYDLTIETVPEQAE